MKKLAMTVAFATVLLMMQVVAEEAELTPKNVDEGFNQLQSVLGRSDPSQARQFRIVIDKEFKNKPLEDQPEVLIVSRGDVLVGNPYRMGQAIAFDMIEAVRLTIYEVQQNERRKKKFRENRYMAIRYVMRQDDNHQWKFESSVVSHSDPRIVESHFLKGSVKWIKNGFELDGFTESTTYTSEGKNLPVAVYAKLNFLRAGDELYIDDQWQDYALGKGPDGKTLPYPDFSQPIGRSDSWYSRIVSEHIAR
ncbi:hypothetical protein [Endozoicomonas arenosclerae]|uniref:hypothetical protein n=1 Tax=Endozoicomonas arenosclerae TaxID=1633495 RepID=UPI0007842B73|nr:hypothetical protein [Endozoicomonas arenosclerae]